MHVDAAGLDAVGIAGDAERRIGQGEGEAAMAEARKKVYAILAED